MIFLRTSVLARIDTFHPVKESTIGTGESDEFMTISAAKVVITTARIDVGVVTWFVASVVAIRRSERALIRFGIDAPLAVKHHLSTANIDRFHSVCAVEITAAARLSVLVVAVQLAFAISSYRFLRIINN